MSDATSFYESLPQIKDESGEVVLHASFTANNGIRIQLLDSESDDADWRVFDFNNDQAEVVGQALVRWAQRRRAEAELNRCNVRIFAP